MLHSACVNVTPTARTLPLCAVAGDSGIDEQWRIKNSRIQSGAVLWLRHSFARAFSGDSLLGDSLPVDCFALLAMTRKYFGGATLVALFLSLRAFDRMRGNQRARNPDTVDCHEAKPLAMTRDNDVSSIHRHLIASAMPRNDKKKWRCGLTARIILIYC